MCDLVMLPSNPTRVAESEDHQRQEREHEERINAQPQPDFLFVAETGSGRASGKVLRMIRSHAKRKRYPSRRKRMPAERPRPLASTDEQRDDAAQATVISISHPIQRRQLMSLHRAPKSRSPDPFNALPIEDQGSSHYMCRLYPDTVWPVGSPYYPPLPSFTCREIALFAMSDAAVLHLFLANVALRLCAMEMRVPTDIMSTSHPAYHTSKAVEIINNRISNVEYESISNETVFAVCCFVHAEIMSPSSNKLKIHMDGLEALVNYKGGIQALSIRINMDYRIDSICAIALGSEPRFSLARTITGSQRPFETKLTPIAQKYALTLANLTGLEEISKDTIKAYLALRYLIVTNTKFRLTISQAEFDLMSNELMRRLIKIVQHKVLPTPHNYALIHGLFGHAALIHATTLYFHPVRRGSLLELASTRIRAILEVVDIRLFQIAWNEMILWVTTVGGLASIGTNNEQFFVRTLAESCLVSGIANAVEELPKSLDEFLWSKSYMSPVCAEFWKAVGRVQVEGD